MLLADLAGCHERLQGMADLGCHERRQGVADPEWCHERLQGLAELAQCHERLQGVGLPRDEGPEEMAKEG